MSFEPHSTVAACASGQAVAMLPACVAASLGVPLDLASWAIFGGLLGIASSEPRQPPLEGFRLIGSIAWALFAACGVGVALAMVATDVAASVLAKSGIAVTHAAALPNACATLLGFGTTFLPELARLVRSRLVRMGDQS